MKRSARHSHIILEDGEDLNSGSGNLEILGKLPKSGLVVTLDLKL